MTEFSVWQWTKQFSDCKCRVKSEQRCKITEHYTLPVSIMAMWNPALKYARIQLAATVF